MGEKRTVDTTSPLLTFNTLLQSCDTFCSSAVNLHSYGRYRWSNGKLQDIFQCLHTMLTPIEHIPTCHVFFKIAMKASLNCPSISRLHCWGQQRYHSPLQIVLFSVNSVHDHRLLFCFSNTRYTSILQTFLQLMDSHSAEIIGHFEIYRQITQNSSVSYPNTGSTTHCEYWELNKTALSFVFPDNFQFLPINLLCTYQPTKKCSQDNTPCQTWFLFVNCAHL